MKIENLDVGQFIGRYGSQSWIDDNTQKVIVGGSKEDITSYLGAAGFVQPYGIFSKTGSSEFELARDLTDYGGISIDAFSDLTGLEDDFGLIENAKQNSKEIGSAVGSYVPNSVKKLGAALPLKGREHARIYRLQDGRYAAELHKDPGISDYIDGGKVLDGDITEIFSGIGKAIKYHYIDPKINEYKSAVKGWLAGSLDRTSAYVKPTEAGL